MDEALEIGFWLEETTIHSGFDSPVHVGIELKAQILHDPAVARGFALHAYRSSLAKLQSGSNGKDVPVGIRRSLPRPRLE